MRQHTTPEQTAKLIELGFRPKARINEVQVVHSKINVVHDCNFTIGELIEMLPPIIVWKRKNLASTIARTTFNSFVSYAELDGTPHIVEKSTELIDALYVMILKLKEEGVI